MKKLKQSLLIATALLFVGIGQAFAQTQTINDVGRTSLRNLGSIMDGNIIKGYYFFYFSEKADRKNWIYEVVVYDENLKEVSSESIKESKKAYLLESSYNGKSIMFKFFDTKEKTVIYRAMSVDGGESTRAVREASKHEIRTYSLMMQKQMTNTSLNNINSETFMDVALYKDKSYKYKAHGVDNNGEVTWEYTPSAAKGVLAGAYIGSSKKQILILQGETKNALSRDAKFSLVAISSEDGGELFKLPMKSSKYNLMPFSTFYNNEGNIVIMGQYYKLSDKAMKSDSEGIFIKVITSEGEDVTETFLSWDRDIKNMLPADQRKEISAYSLYFHDIQVTKDGRIVAIAEQYRKQVSAAGVALKMAGGTAGALEIKIGNMVVVTLSKTFELDDIKILEKTPNRFNVGEGYELVNQHVLAHVIKAQGGFDYSYTQVNEDKSLISVGYIDSEKTGSLLKRDLVLNIVSFNAGEKEPTTDKISLETESNYLWVLPAKPGHVLISEYFRKKKTFEMRIEPINH